MISINILTDTKWHLRIQLDPALGVLYAEDPVIVQPIMEIVQEETRYFGIVGMPMSTGSDILKDPWATFLWLERMGFAPAWPGKPPKIPAVPKGAVV
jgi:hypothetical protein